MQSSSSIINKDLLLSESENSPLRRESSPTQSIYTRHRPLEYGSNSRSPGSPDAFNLSSLYAILDNILPPEDEYLPQEFSKVIANRRRKPKESGEAVVPLEPELIGDFSRNFGLPLTKCRHQDLKAISAQTLAELMRGRYQDIIASYKIIDCRFPYEFDGGHIAGAVNLYTREQCTELLNNDQLTAANSTKRNILIFHCEFSVVRGPTQYRYLRIEDRRKNKAAYPSLNFPEVYLLEGGYKSFFVQFSNMCTPESYKQMRHPDHKEDLRYFIQKIWKRSTNESNLHPWNFLFSH